MSMLRHIWSVLISLFVAGEKPREETADEIRERHLRGAYEQLLVGLKACTSEDPVNAIVAFQQAFVGYHAAGSMRQASLTQKVISLLFIYIKDAEQVRIAYRNARRVLEQANLRDEAARVMMFAGDFEADNGDSRLSDRNFNAAVELCRRISYHRGEIEALCRHGLAIARRGKVADARAQMALADAIADRIGDPKLVELVEREAAKVVGAASASVMASKAAAEAKAAAPAPAISIASLTASRQAARA